MGRSLHTNSHGLFSERQKENADQSELGIEYLEADIMANVFIVSANDVTTTASFGMAMGKSYELEALLPLIQEKRQIEDLWRIYPDGKCYLWGAQESGDNFSTWNIMTEEDLILGFRNLSIVFASYVLMKIHHPVLATRIWGNSGTPFGLMCFLDEPQTGEVPIVSQMSRYLDRDYTGFTKLDSAKRDHILSDYGSLEGFVRLGLGYDFPFSLRHSE
jgi:hypothetical protein